LQLEERAMMDPAMLERAFALRDEVQKSQIGANGPDLSKLAGSVERAARRQLPSLPDDKLAIDLMKRAVALREQANEARNGQGRSSDEQIMELLRGAAAPLRAFDNADLAAERPE
jgi:hypothetical protein